MGIRLLTLAAALLSAQLGGLLASRADVQPPGARLAGAWQATAYVIKGVEHPAEGVLLFTDRHFSSTVTYNRRADGLRDMNANAGTYRTEGDRIVLQSAVAGHIRPGSTSEPIHYGGGEEAARFTVEGDVLTIIFPSTNRYVARRVR